MKGRGVRAEALKGVLICALAGPGLMPSQAAPAHEMGQAQRLSAWLQARGDAGEGWWAWYTADERARAQPLWPLWRQHLQQQWRGAPGAASSGALAQWMMAAQPQGRVPLGPVHVPWLQANPSRDPWLQPGDVLMPLPRQGAVGVLGAQGVCWLPHRSGAVAQDYVDACGVDRRELLPDQQVWLIQPDAQVRSARLAPWAPEHLPEMAPGALVWLGWPDAVWREGLSPAQRLAASAETADWLARLWPSPSAADLSIWKQAHWASPAPGLAGPGHDVRPSASDWGVVGLLQTPTARMRAPGSVAVGLHHVSPYSWLNVTLQPFDWMETAFRYVSASNMLYGPQEFSGSQSFKDKSIEVKLRLHKESEFWPAIGLGVRDLGGTGLFGSEYLVANKRWGRWDWSLGMGWGNMAGRGDWPNPLSSVLGANWERRGTSSADVGEAGKLNSNRLFHGRTVLFGGVQYQSPGGTVLKAEIEGNNFQREPNDTRLPQRSPINIGLVRALHPHVDLAVGYERGNTWSVGLTLWTDLSRTHVPKLFDPQAPAVRAERPPAGYRPDWERTRSDVQALTDWRVERMALEGERLVLDVSDSDAPYREPRLQRAWAVLHRDAPAQVERFEVRHRQLGEVLALQAQDRQAWLQPQLQPPRTAEAPKAADLSFVPSRPVLAQAPSLVEPRQSWTSWSPSLSLIQSLGGPDAFMLYQISAAMDGQWQSASGLQAAGRVRARLFSNYDRFKFEGFSDLPRVRTHVREYLTTSVVTLSHLYAGQAQRLSTDWSASIYGGYLEEMFAGVGGELLYRRPGSRWAAGVDLNRVRQRDFAQDLGLRDYQVNTGHLSLYWQTPWQSVDLTLQAGQYLAGDRGATLTASRVFENGLRMGAFATLTNVSSQQFGEGSFNKGIFVSLPFDAFLSRSSKSTAMFNWVPVTRDGGALLGRPMRLIDASSWLGAPERAPQPARSGP